MNTFLHPSLRRVVLMAGLTLVTAMAVQAEFVFDAEVPLDTEVEKAITRAQDGLAKAQQPNGSWGTCNGVNAMVLIALMVNGSTPGHTKHGAKIAKAVEFLIANQKDSGYLVAGGEGNMYQHGLATIALAEAYGMSHNPAIRESLTKAVQLTLKAQNTAGGWRYKPVPLDDDLSVTVVQVMSLRAAIDDGIYVPKNAIDFGIKYVKSHWNPDVMGFSYGRHITGKTDDVNPRMTAAGIVCLQSYGLADDPCIPPAVQYVLKNIDYDCGTTDRYGWYGHYYASVALYHYGGDAWKTYHQKMCQRILKEWKNTGGFNAPLTTAWGILVMGTPYRYLPIYQK